MKKFAKTLIAMTIVTVSVMLLSLGVSAADTPEYLPGDLNGDGLVNTTDVVYLRRYIAGGYGIELKPVPGTNCPTNEVIDPAVAPTCTATGLTEGKHCGSCGTVLVKQEIVPAKGHQYANGICTGCGQTEPTAVTLTYTVNDDGKTCTITGLATGNDANIVIPEKIDGYTVTAIGQKAFSDLTHLTSVTIPETVTLIDTRAFYGCTGLTEITIPASVTKIGTNIFQKCDNLKTVICNSSGWDSTSETILFGCAALEKVVLNGKSFTSAQCSGMTNIKEVVIGNSITVLPDSAFEFCTGLERITIHEGVTTIGGRAFYRCTALKNINIPNSVINIFGSAFFGCTSLTSVTLSNNLTSINWALFSECTSLTSIHIPQSVKTIGGMAFYRCLSLSSITIPDNVTDIGEYAFQHCTGLTSFVIPDSIASISSGVFYGCTNLTSFTIPDTVTGIGSYAFYECTNLHTIKIPNSVSNIGEGAFKYCNNLTNIIFEGTKAQWDTISKGNEWNNDTPSYTIHCTDGDICKEHSEVTDPAVAATCTTTGLTEGKHCSKCNAVLTKQEIIPAKGHQYANGICSGCGQAEPTPDEYFTFTLLPGGTYSVKAKDVNNMPVNVVIPASYQGKAVTSIGEEAFCKCRRLESIIIPNSVTNIGSSAFKECSSLTSVTISDSVTNIGSSAFSKCSRLNSIIIPNSVTNIGGYAFAECRGLSSINIPDSVTSIGESGFSGCDSLIEVHITDIAAWCNIDFYSYDSNPLNNANAHQLYLNGTLVTDLVIPDGVTSIGDYAFDHCGNLTSVTIPDNVTSIGDMAFRKCSNLTEVHITDIAAWCNIDFYDSGSNPLGYAHKLYLNGTLVTNLVIPNGVTSISNYAFYECSSLTSVTIPDSVTSIGSSAFKGCSSLTSITIPDSVTSIGFSAFNGCSSLTSVTIPDSVTNIGIYAFYKCSSLASIAIPEGVTSIGASTFEGCSKLASITIPDGVTSINGRAFYGCGRLASITIPEGVTSIDDYTFYYCSRLTSITIPDGVTNIDSHAFDYCVNLTSVTIPSSVTSIGAYAFSHCERLTEVHITDIAAWCNIDYYDSASNPFYYAQKLYLNGTLVTDLVIPNGVTSISSSAFAYCSSLTSVIIPDSVTSIGSYTFEDCSGLTSITYTGTKAQWNAISKGSYWNHSTGSYIVYCTDGNIKK